ncbi:Protein kinase [Gonapodya sp. JEL0774]|nr:Protein kinase [Gonapodya sp. JEL0774]
MITATALSPKIVKGATGNWTLGECLGSGAFAEVRQARSDSGVEGVVKIAFNSSASTDLEQSLYSRRELAVLAHLSAKQHPNIVKLYDAAIVNDTIYIFMQKVDGVELYDFLKSRGDGLSTVEASRITAQLLSALRFMHSHHVLHRDIKLDNILVNPDTLHVTLIDFNLSCFYREGVSLYESVGCINYSSPQILEAARGNPYLPKRGWSDLWALGVTVYCILCGYFPFRSEKATKLAKEHLSLRTQSLPWYHATVDPVARDFVEKILHPASRGDISAESLLEHPFIVDFAAPSDVFPADATVLPWDSRISQTSSLLSRDLDIQEDAVRALLKEFLQPPRIVIAWPAGAESNKLAEDLCTVTLRRLTSTSTVGAESNDSRSSLDSLRTFLTEKERDSAKNWKLVDIERIRGFREENFNGMMA